jgi:ATP synthase protein I
MHAKVNEKPGKFGQAYHAAKMSSVGIEVAVATLIGWGIGHWLDSRLGTGPYLTIVFFLCGVVAGFKALIRAGKEAQRVAMGGSIDPDAAAAERAAARAEGIDTQTEAG